MPAVNPIRRASEFLLAQSTILALGTLRLGLMSGAVEVALIKLIGPINMPYKLIVVLVWRGALAIEELLVRLLLCSARMLLILSRVAALPLVKGHAQFIVFVSHILLKVECLGLLSVLV